MPAIAVFSDNQRSVRNRELAEVDAQKEINRINERKNKGFTQVYARGWRRIRELSQGNSGAAGLYAFFAEHIEPNCGAVVCDQQFLAAQFNVSTRTIRNWLKYLEEAKALVRIPIAGKVCAYALDPGEVWKGYDNSKEYAAFSSKTLVNKDGNIQRRIKAMFNASEGSDES